MKKFLMVLAAVALLLLPGCGGDQYASDETSMFCVVESSTNYKVYYHKETKVMYARASYGSFAVLVNPDGSPMLWEAG